MNPLLFVIFFTLALFANQKVSVAVLPFESKGADSSFAPAYTDRLRSELVLGGVFKVLERDQMNLILQEHGLQQSLCLSNTCMQEMGGLLNVEALIIGSFHRIGEVLSVNVKRVDIATGEISNSYTFDYKGDSPSFLTQGLPQLARQIENKKQNRLQSKQVIRYETPIGLGLLALSAGSFAIGYWQNAEAKDALSRYKKDIDNSLNPSTSAIESRQMSRNLFYLAGGLSFLGGALLIWAPWLEEAPLSFHNGGVQWQMHF